MRAIDGLRALSVVAVLLFHAGVPGASGGYLGVSVFFTISGYVITRSLVARADARHGRAPLALGQFYARRARRLLPASLATIVVCAVLARLGALPSLSGQALRWTTLHGANWYQWDSGSDYAALFAGQGGDRDPLVHFWSLAIEEQFYAVWPLVMLVVLRLPRRGRLWTVTALAAGLAGVTIALGDSGDPRTAYYHTLFRVPEILIGCALAVLVGTVSLGAHTRRAAGLVGPAGLVALAVAVIATDSGSGAWPYRGLLPLLAVVSAAVIWAACVPGRFAAALAWRPLVELGRISYGVYLFHWPIFVILLERGWSWAAVAGVGIPLAVTLAGLSFHGAELPLTRIRGAVRPTLATGLAAMLLVLGVVTLTAGRSAPAVALPELDPAVLAAVDFVPGTASPSSSPSSSPSPTGAAASTAPATTTPAATATPASTPASAADTTGSTTSSTSTTTAAPREPLRVLVVGDSTAESLSVGLTEWALTHPELQVSVAAFGACGLVQGGEYALAMLDAALQLECAERHARTIPDALPLADVVVVLVTLADVWERSWDGGATWLGPHDPEFRTRLADDYAAFADSVRAAGVPTLLWLRPPVSSYDGGRGATAEASFTDGTQEWIESVVAGLAAAEPGRVAIGDLRGWYEASPLAGDPAARLDGTHFSREASAAITRDWLVPQLAALPHRSTRPGVG